MIERLLTMYSWNTKADIHRANLDSTQASSVIYENKSYVYERNVHIIPAN